MRRLWIGLGILFVLLVAGVVGLNLWVHAYLRSDAFRQLISAKTGETLHIDAEYQPLDWSGSSVYSSSLKGVGESGAPLESLDAEQVRANVDWKAIFDGVWRVSRADIVRLDVKIRSATERVATAQEPGPTPMPAPPKKSFLPNRFQLDIISVQDANLSVGNLAQTQHSALTMRPEGNGWIFDGTGGRLELANRAPLEIGNFRVRLQQGVVYLTDSTLRLGESGAIQATGEVGGVGAPFDIRLAWQGVSSADVLDAEWKERLSGVISGDAHSMGREKKPPVTRGHFQLTDGMLKGLPVQSKIAKFTQTPQFERMPLQTVSGDYSYDGTTLIVTNFVLESQGLLRVEGDCTTGANDSITGTFQVGVTSQSLQWLPGSQEKVFVTSRNGYLWTTVNVSGTLQNPVEDLSDRLARAMGEQVIDTGMKLIEDAPEKATKKAGDTVDKVLDILTPLIP
ncbi:MAG: hypothetical protein ACREKL_04525 [Chthoniobacterales bacterium]